MKQEYFVDYYGQYKHLDIDCGGLDLPFWLHEPSHPLSVKTNAVDKKHCPRCWV